MPLRTVLGLLFVVVAVAIAVCALLLVRRRAPEGGFFTGGGRRASSASWRPAFGDARFRVAVLGITLLVIRQLESTCHSGPGALEPVAMQRTLVILDEEVTVAGVRIPPLCDGAGAPLPA